MKNINVNTLSTDPEQVIEYNLDKDGSTNLTIEMEKIEDIDEEQFDQMMNNLLEMPIEEFFNPLDVNTINEAIKWGIYVMKHSKNQTDIMISNGVLKHLIDVVSVTKEHEVIEYIFSFISNYIFFYDDFSFFEPDFLELVVDLLKSKIKSKTYIINVLVNLCTERNFYEMVDEGEWIKVIEALDNKNDQLEILKIIVKYDTLGENLCQYFYLAIPIFLVIEDNEGFDTILHIMVALFDSPNTSAAIEEANRHINADVLRKLQNLICYHFTSELCSVFLFILKNYISGALDVGNVMNDYGASKIEMLLNSALTFFSLTGHGDYSENENSDEEDLPEEKWQNQFSIPTAISVENALKFLSEISKEELIDADSSLLIAAHKLCSCEFLKVRNYAYQYIFNSLYSIPETSRNEGDIALDFFGSDFIGGSIEFITNIDVSLNCANSTTRGIIYLVQKFPALATSIIKDESISESLLEYVETVNPRDDDELVENKAVLKAFLDGIADNLFKSHE